MTDTPLLGFTHCVVDRLDDKREDAAWLQAQRSMPHSQVIPFWRGRPLIENSHRPQLGWRPCDHIDHEGTWLLLGRQGEDLYFAVDLTDPLPAEADWMKNGRFQGVRALAEILSPEEASLLAQARAMFEWHRSCLFCSWCGGKTEPHSAGYKRQCLKCERSHFPRTDPVVIMLVHHNDRCLLGRRRRYPPGMFSCLAGFMEPGETIEAAVRREVLEETKIKIDAVTYHANQPWPFPGQLMIGCMAEAVSHAIEINENELETAQWFSKQEIQAALKGEHPEGLSFPPYMAIARHLIHDWAYDTT